MNLHPRTRFLLQKVGLAPLELEALDHPERHQVPNEPRGFGLRGETGTGKTWALVQYLARYVNQCVLRQPDPDRATLLWIDGDVARDSRILWVCWLAQAEKIRRRRLEKVWIESWAEEAEGVTILVLDDIGREERDLRNDPAQEVLQRVIEHRHRWKRPLIWTSNRTPEELANFYGGPMASRILGTWPDYEVGGQDMRLFPMGEFKKAAGGDE